MESKAICIDKIDQDILKLLDYNFNEKEEEFENIPIDKSVLIIWRVEKLKLIKVPESSFGTFYEGDTFLILKINPNEKEYNIHIWIGNESSKDEMEFVSFKVFQLDNKFGNKGNIIYENQDNESSLFLSYFPCFYINKGGVDPFQGNSDKSTIKARLFQVHSKGANIKLYQVSINKKSLNSTDSFLFDIGVKVFIWKGKESSGFSKFHVNVLSEKIKAQRYGKVQIVSIDEVCTLEKEKKNLEEFEDLLKRFEEEYKEVQKKEEKTEAKDNNIRMMMKLSDESGKLLLSEVPYELDSLNSNDSFLIDRGDEIIIWVGNKTSKNEKRYGRFYANRYLVKQKRPLNLPILVINEGKLSKKFDECFSK